MQTFLLPDILGGSRFPGVLVGQKGLYMRRSHLLTMVDEMSDVRYKPEYIQSNLVPIGLAAQAPASFGKTIVYFPRRNNLSLISGNLLEVLITM